MCGYDGFFTSFFFFAVTYKKKKRPVKNLHNKKHHKHQSMNCFDNFYPKKKPLVKVNVSRKGRKWAFFFFAGALFNTHLNIIYTKKK